MNKSSVLVVEDNAITRKMMRVALESAGYGVFEAPDGKTAIRIAKNEFPALILQDLLLPDMDGLDLVRELRRSLGNDQVPILACTGLMSKLDEARTIQGGFTDYLFKPVEPSRLIQVIDRYLTTPPQQIKSPKEKIKVLLVDDDPIELKLEKIILEAQGFTVTTANDGKEAWQTAQKSKPDAVLCDLIMPNMNGFDLCMALRKDSRFAALPIVITSATSPDIEQEDRKLAEKVGADAFVGRTPDLKEAVKALREALKRRSHPKPSADSGALTENYLQRLVGQLEQQTSRNGDLMRRAAEEKAQLAVVASITETLNRKLPLQAALDEALARILDAAGISVGAVYLAEPDGKLILQSQIGYGEVKLDELHDFFGHSDLLYRALNERKSLTMPSPEITGSVTRELQKIINAQSLLIAPLVAADEPQGVLVAFSSRTELGDEWVASVKTVTAQLAQAVLLARTLARVSESEQRFRELAENINEVFFVINADGGKLDYVSPAYEHVFGRKKDGLYRDARDWTNAVHPDDRPRVERAYQSRLDNFNEEYRVVRPDGQLRWLYARTFPVKDDSGKMVRIVGIAEDVTQRKLAEVKLRMQSAALEAAANGIVITNRDGLIIWVNPAFSKLTGYSSQEAIGRNPRLLKSDVQDRLFYKNLWNTILSGEIWSGEIVNRRKDGMLYTEEQSITPVHDNKGEISHFIAIKQDITERKRAEKSLERRYQELHALQEVSQIVLTSPDVQTAMETILEKTMVLGSYDLGIIRLVDSSARTIKPVAFRGYRNPENIQSHPRIMTNDSNGKLIARVVTLKEPHIEEDVPNSEGLRTWKKESVHSAIIIPVRAKEEVLGIFQLGTRTRRKFSPDEVRLLLAIADQMGIAIQKARLNEETRQNLDRIRALHEIDLAITSTLDLRTILNVLLEKIEIFLPIAASTVRLLNRDTRDISSVACRGLDEDQWKSQARASPQGRARTVIETKAPVSVSNIQVDTQTYNPAVFRGLVSYLGVPLVAHGDVLGILAVYTQEQHQFSNEEIDFLKTLASQAAIAIYNAQLYAKIDSSRRELELTNRYLERSLKQLSGLYTALSPLSPSESIRETMGGIVERLMEATGTDAALIRIWNIETNSYSIAGQKGFPDFYLKRVETAPAGGAVEWVVQHGEPIIAGDISGESRFKGKVQMELGLRSCAMLPLKVHNETRGIIHLSSRTLGYFDVEQQDHLMAIARQMGIALENRELFDNLRDSRDELEKANRVKDEFLSVMSHELRTPLSVVIGYTGLVKDGSLGAVSKQQKDALQKVLLRAGDQLEMINEIMQTTQLEARAMNANYDLFDLQNFLDNLRSDYEVRGGGKNIRLIWHYPAAAMPVVTDGPKIKQILQNLINNALKFIEQGTVAVSAHLVEEDGGRSSDPSTPASRWVEFTVTDTGIGIVKEMQQAIFEKFYQVDSSETRLYGGVGLGLYIVKQFTDLLRGQINLESELGKGTTFTLRIPLER